MKVVEVLWGDAWINVEDCKVKKARKLKPVVRTTIGFLIAENEDAIVLCTDFYADDKKTINAPMVIPWGMVLSWWEYV